VYKLLSKIAREKEINRCNFDVEVSVVAQFVVEGSPVWFYSNSTVPFIFSGKSYMQ